MTKPIKLFCSIVCLLATLFIGVGYAAISGSLNITGTASYREQPYVGLYISNVTVVSASKVTVTENKIAKPTNLTSAFQVSSSGATVTLAIEVTNNSDMTYWYQSCEGMDGVESNDLLNKYGGITISTADHQGEEDSFNQDDWVPPAEGDVSTVRTFYATYSFGANATGEVTLMINFKFGKRLDAVQDGFENILNNESTYEYLVAAFNEEYKNNMGSTVLGNIGEDAEIFDNLFGPDLTVNVNGEEKPVTIMIARENVDKRDSGDAYPDGGPQGCEYTIYVTVDDLDNGKEATVYAVTYTCGSDGKWYQIGELYEGTSSVGTYKGNEGAFEIERWKANQKSYEVMNGLSYQVANPSAQPEYQCSTIEQIMTAPMNDFKNMWNNDDVKKQMQAICKTVYNYTGQNKYSGREENENNKNKPGYAALKAAFDQFEPYLQINNQASDVRLLDDLTDVYRSELISKAEKLFEAYEYFLEVNSYASPQ